MTRRPAATTFRARLTLRWTLAAIDLQGGIWTVPAGGGAARRVTGVYEDARQPVWSPDGRWITYFSYKDGGYDLWNIAPDGSGQHRLTWGPFDDREPVWSHDGSRVAFSSDRGNPLGSDYNIWVLDTRTGELRQLTREPSEDYMPSWSPDDREIAFASTRDNGQSIWAVSVGDFTQRKVATVNGARLDSPSWSSNGQVVYHATAASQSRYEVAGAPITGTENVFAFRASWATPTDFYYVSNGQIRRRALGTTGAQTVAFTATLQVTQPQYTRRVRDFTSTRPRKVLGIVRPVLSPDGSQIAFAAVGDICVVYPCFCPPEQIEAEREAARASGGQPRYSGRCRWLTPSEASRRVAAGEPTALRRRPSAGRPGAGCGRTGTGSARCSRRAPRAAPARGPAR